MTPSPGPDFDDERADRFCVAVLIALCVILAVALAVSIPATCHAAPLDQASLARCEELRPEAEVAADLAGVPVQTILALVYHETRCLPLPGRTHPVHGYAQIRRATWQQALDEAGLTLADLYSPMGVVAAGLILGEIRQSWPWAEPWRLLCLYASGVDALDYQRDCPYSRAVAAIERGWR
jgi:hypothetical protein